MITLATAVEILDTLGGHPESPNQTGPMSDADVLRHGIEQANRNQRDQRRRAFWATLTRRAASCLGLPGQPV